MVAMCSLALSRKDCRLESSWISNLLADPSEAFFFSSESDKHESGDFGDDTVDANSPLALVSSVCVQEQLIAATCCCAHVQKSVL